MSVQAQSPGSAGLGPVKAAALLGIFLGSVAMAGGKTDAEPRCRPIPEAAATVAALNAFWGRSVRLCQSPDPHESAVAVPEDNLVEANRRFLAEVTRDYGAPAATGILAHEWGHMVQRRLRGRAAELHADCLAGAFLRRAGYDKRAITRFALLSLESGDDGFAFDDHGTGPERQAAVLRGYEGVAARPVRELLAYCRP
jgi:hypothetical protein